MLVAFQNGYLETLIQLHIIWITELSQAVHQIKTKRSPRISESFEELTFNAAVRLVIPKIFLSNLKIHLEVALVTMVVANMAAFNKAARILCIFCLGFFFFLLRVFYRERNESP